MQNGTDATQSPASDRLSDSVLEWNGRTYETMEEWKAKARDVFFSSNGDSNLAVTALRRSFEPIFLNHHRKPKMSNVGKRGLRKSKLFM